MRTRFQNNNKLISLLTDVLSFECFSNYISKKSSKTLGQSYSNIFLTRISRKFNGKYYTMLKCIKIYIFYMT